LVGALASALITALVIQVQRPIYRASASLVLPSSAAGGALSFAGLTKSASPLSVLEGVARSGRVMRPVARQFNLTPLQLQEILRWGSDEAGGQLLVAVNGPDKDRAVAIVDAAVRQLRIVSQDVAVSLASNQAETLAGAVQAKEKDLRDAENQILAFTRRLQTAPDPSSPYSAAGYVARLKDIEIELGTVQRQLELTTRQAIRSAEATRDELPTGLPQRETWRNRLVEQEYEYRTAITQYGPEAYQVEQIKRQIDVTRRQLESEMQKYIQSVEQQIDANVASLLARQAILEYQKGQIERLADLAPAESVELQRLIREVQTRATLLAKVREQYESSKLESEVYRIPYAVLAPPQAEENPINKDIWRGAVIGGLAGAASAMFAIAMVRAIRLLNQAPTWPEAEQRP
jgi:uncharacterized protein involved in exopolysaccharide biosynthesis